MTDNKIEISSEMSAEEKSIEGKKKVVDQKRKEEEYEADNGIT